MLPLTSDILCQEAALFSALESQHSEPLLYGITDGKAVGTYLEQKFKNYLKVNYDFVLGNSASGIDFPELLIDMKTTRIKQPQSSCPFKSARQKIYGLGYSLIIFVYQKIDDSSDRTAKLNILQTIFVDAARTADFQMTRGIRNILANEGNEDDLIAFLLDRILKSSDIANGKIDYTKKYVLVTQKNIGEPTEKIKQIAPKTWHYLSKYCEYLDNRKSKIYNNKPRFSMFGIGDYSFYKWKIAVSGLYKRLHFQLIGEIDNKSTLFDDTVYFISFEDKKEAEDTFQILNNPKIITFYSSLIFWDEKRPIKASILNKLNIEKAYKLLNNYN